MIRNYLKQVYRQLLKYRLNSIINLFGLSVGIACCFVIFLFVDNEFKYDKYHAHSENIYRITTTETSENAVRNFAHSYLPYAPLIASQISEVDKSVRMLQQSVSVANKSKGVILQEEQFFYVDSTFFDVFSIPLKFGNSATALSEPRSIIISEKIAKKYFGRSDVLGETLTLEQNVLLTISGVFSELPSQSSIQFEMIAPMGVTKETFGPWIADLGKTWYYPQVYTFVKLSSDTGLTNLNKRLGDFDKEFLPEHIQKTRSHELLPLENVHFSKLENEMHSTIDKKILYTFIAAGIVILLIATFNFINLFLARIVLRLKEVGIKRVLGASSLSIWKQTLVESLVYLVLSFILALGWVFMFLPSFNTLMETQLELFNAETIVVWLIILTLLIILSLLISVVPTVFISRFNVNMTLNGLGNKLFKKKRTSVSLQSVLVTFQFAIAVILIVATIVMQSQMSYIKNKNLGLGKEQVVVLPVRDENIQKNFSVLKNKLEQVSSIQSVSAISNFPWSKGYYDFETVITHSGRDIKANAYTLLVDEDFIPTMDMVMSKGRGFSRGFRTDSTAFIMNETAANLYGIKDQTEVVIEMSQIGSRLPKKGKLIGIVKDFHLQSLHKTVEPLILTLASATYFTDNIIIKFTGTDVERTLQATESEVQNMSPNRPFEYFFLDDAFEKLYKKEARVSALFNYFSILSIIIACLGLMGIVAFTTSQRIKEIGIRKVLGASVASIVKLITTSFLKLVFIAIIIAIPLAYLLMSNWLERFSYKINLGWWIFTLAGCCALTIAILTIGYQSIRSAIANPVNSLRSE
ncbi:ABC transporter permease [Winogradskyella sp.]|uniref:ABC transporter permease n=1 Tax=Winogradskyella sp. TaxID=1883156 RepID=UPI003BAB1F80